MIKNRNRDIDSLTRAIIAANDRLLAQPKPEPKAPRPTRRIRRKKG